MFTGFIFLLIGGYYIITEIYLYNPYRLYHVFVGYDLPTEVEDFSGSRFIGWVPIFTDSEGCFIYTADVQYMSWLMHISQIENKNTWEERYIHKVDCTVPLYSEFNAVSTRHPVKYSYNDTCYSGILNEYSHYILFNSDNGQVQHLVADLKS